MNRTIVTTLLAAVLLTLVPCAAQSPSMLLEKGIYNEETKGDISKAVEIYQQIISTANANRKYVAEAQYRLGVCLMKQKKPAQAIECFETLIKDFPNQQKFVAKAKEHIEASKPKITGPELARIVKAAVETISTCTEFDPRIKKALASLDGLNQQETVKEISKFLTSDTPNIRRSAIYILWKGNFKNISSAVPNLLKLCDNEEDKTRGMATLALGQYKIESAFKIISKMAIDDKSSYSRQCAAYALGLMGNPAAKATLEKAVKDKSELVSTNAKVALLMLNSGESKNSSTKSDEIEPLPLPVMMWIIGEHMQAYEKAQSQGLRVNTHIYGVDDKFNKYNGGFLTYKNNSGQSVSQEIPLGNFGRQQPDFELTNEQGVSQKYRLEKRTGNVNGRYRLWWTPDKPIPAGEIRLLGYLNRKTTKLPVSDGVATLNMNNHFGQPVIENFFLVLPANLEIVKSSRPYKTKVQRARFDIYLWQRKIPANQNNTVKVSLKKISPLKDVLPLNKVVERTIYDDGVGKDFWIDLDTGKLYSPDPKIFKMDKQKVHAVIKELGLDAMAETASRRSCLYCVDMSVLPVSNDQWNNKHLARLISDMSGWKTGSPVIMSALGDLPKTYLFKTRNDNIGILQILEKVDKQPRHIKIRYKLLKYAGADEPESKMELSHDDGKFTGMQSFGGTGEGIKFQVPADGFKLTSISFYGMRYGTYETPKEKFDAILCDSNYKPIKKFSFPYSKFAERGDAKWVNLPVEPTAVPKDFVIFLNFHAHKTKGIYVYFSKAQGNDSLAGLPGQPVKNFTKGNWMIRCEVQRDSNDKKQQSYNEAPQDTNPVVLKTSPKALSDDVSPSRDKITVTFDQEMMNGSWSWTGSGDTFPKVTGKIHYDASRKTCTLPVQLQPGKVYWIGINSPSHKNFKTPDRKPARRYVILFATRDEDEKATPIPQKMYEAAQEINYYSGNPAAVTPPGFEEYQAVIMDNSVVNLDNGNIMALKKQWPDSFDLMWDNDMNGILVRKPNSDTRIFAITNAQSLKEAFDKACENIENIRKSQSRGIPAKGSRYLAVLTSDNLLAIIEIVSHTSRQAKLKWWVGSPEKSSVAMYIINSARHAEARKLLDAETLRDVQKIDRMFGRSFMPDEKYIDASKSEKQQMIHQWIQQAKSRNFRTRTNAIAQLGNVRAPQAVDVLIEIAKQPMRNNRPRWLAVRGLGEIGNKKAVPVLIELVDHGNWNTNVYARAALAQITGVYFGKNKEQWLQWWKESGDSADASFDMPVTHEDKIESENLATAGWKLWNARKLSDAEEKFRQAVKKDPQNANAWNGLGWAQFNQGKPANAEKAFENCINIEPEHSAALNGLGWIAKNKGQTDKAVTYWKKAVKAFPGATASLSGLTEVYMQRGDYNQAIKYYRMWVKAEPKNEQAAQGLEKAQAICDDTQEAQKAAKKWLDLVDKGKYVKSWQTSADFFKANVSESKWDKSIKAIRESLGKMQKRKLISAKYTTSLPGAPDGKYVVIQYKADFKNKPQAIETVTPMMEKDGRWKISGYYIK